MKGRTALIKNLLSKYGIYKTTTALSLVCIVASVLISTTSWQLAGLPNLRFVFMVSFLCPTLIAPPFILVFCRLTQELQHSKNQLMQANAELQKNEEEKIKIYTAMINSTHHIMNNFLHEMMLFKLTAEETPGFDHDVLALYEEIIADASRQIEALSSITNVDEESIYASVALKPKVDQTPNE